MSTFNSDKTVLISYKYSIEVENLVERKIKGKRVVTVDRISNLTYSMQKEINATGNKGQVRKCYSTITTSIN